MGVNKVNAVRDMFTHKGLSDRQSAHGAIIKRKKGPTMFFTAIEQAFAVRDQLTPEIITVIADVFKNKGMFVKIETDPGTRPYDYSSKIEVWSAIFKDGNTHSILRVG